MTRSRKPALRPVASAPAVSTALLLLLTVALLGLPVAPAPAHAAGVSIPAAAEASHWMRAGRAAPRSVGVRQSVACVTLSHCTAVDDGGNASVWNGKRWGRRRPADHDLGPLTSVSCPTKTFCAAVGGVREVVERNGSWGAVHVAPAVLSSVSCWAAGHCRAVGDEGVTMRYGHGWHPGPAAGSFDLVAISCPSGHMCMAINSAGATYRLRNGRWVPTGLAFGRRGGRFFHLSCGSARLCVAATDSAVVSRWNGSRWARRSLLKGPSYLLDGTVSCSGAGFCAWYTSGGYVATWQRGWSAVRHHKRIGGIEAAPVMDCPARARCLLVGARHTTVWRHGLHRTKTGFDPFDAVSVDCPTSGTCVSVNNVSAPMRFHAGRWTKQPVRTRVPTGQVSCAGTTFCASLTADDGRVYLWRGHAWSDGTALDSADHWSIDCATPQYCMAAGVTGDGHAPFVVWDGHTWSGIPDALGFVQCPAASDCWTFGGTYVMHWSGSSWSPAQKIFSPSDGTGEAGISCPDTGFCVAYDATGQISYYRGGSWGGSDQVDPLADLSCASATWCVGMLADRPGYVATYDGRSWSVARALPKGYGGTGLDVSCAGQGTCMLVDAQGNAFRRTA